MAIEASMLGAAHALANPLTAHFGIAHGQAVGVMMPAVLRANGRETHIAELYRMLLVDLRTCRLVRETFTNGWLSQSDQSLRSQWNKLRIDQEYARQSSCRAMDRFF
jgi:alcohol dehydrogenase class IV